MRIQLDFGVAYFSEKSIWCPNCELNWEGWWVERTNVDVGFMVDTWHDIVGWPVIFEGEHFSIPLDFVPIESGTPAL